MRRPIRMLLLGVTLIVGTAILSSLTGSSTSTPYLSALSNGIASQTVAAPAPCEEKACAGGSRHNIVCAKTPGFALKCVNLGGGICSDQSC